MVRNGISENNKHLTVRHPWLQEELDKDNLVEYKLKGIW